jgi:hypothetical protein
MGPPEPPILPSEEPVPTGSEGRLVGARLSVNVLLGGVLVLMLVALALSFFTKGTTAGRSEPPAPNASEAPRWNGSNTQVSNWPTPLSRDAAHASDNSPTGNQSSGANNGMSSGVASSQNTTTWSPPGAQPLLPTSVPAAHGSSPGSGQTPQTSAAEATNPWGSGSRGGPWSNPSAAAGTAADRVASAWGDPSQSVTAVPKAAPLTDPNRPAGPMMPTAPLVHNGVYEAASPAPAFPNNSFGPSAYTADARSRASAAPSGTGAAAGPSSYPNADAAGVGATYPNAVANPYSNSASNNFTPGNNQPNASPSNGYPPNNYPPNNYPPSGYPANASPSGGYPSSGYPANASPANANPSGGYPPSGYPANASPSGGYPPSGYPANASPSGGYPSSGYPAGASPANGYPSTGYPPNNYPSNNANVPYPVTSGPAVAPTTNGAAGYNGGAADPARARFDGGIERPTTIPGGYDNARSSLH